MTFKEISVALLAIILSVGCAEHKFESRDRSVSTPVVTDGSQAPSELPNGGGLPAGVNPEDPNVVIENLGDGANDILDSIIGGLGGILGSLFPDLGGNGGGQDEIPPSICSDKLNLVMVFDASDSMELTPGNRPGVEKKIASAKKVVNDFLGGLTLKSGDSIRLSLSNFKTVLQNTVAGTQNKNTISNEVNNIQPLNSLNPNFFFSIIQI